MEYSVEESQVFESAKEIIDSVPTGGMSPEEALRALDNIGVEWHLTELGKLWVRVWQIGAEDFVSREEAAGIRSERPSPEQGDELDWLSRNLQNVREQYGGQWVAVYNKEIAAAAPNLPDLMGQIAELDKPFITFIPPDRIVWKFTYADKRL